MLSRSGAGHVFSFFQIKGNPLKNVGKDVFYKKKYNMISNRKDRGGLWVPRFFVYFSFRFF